MHVLSDEAPRDAEYFPGWHLEHQTAPEIVENLEKRLFGVDGELISFVRTSVGVWHEA